MEYEIVSVLRP